MFSKPQPFMLPLLLCLAAASALPGCGPVIRAESEAFNYAGEMFEQRVTASRIRVFEGEKPARKYAKVAKIVARPVFGTTEDAFEELRKRAAAMGADAVMDVVFEAEKMEYATPGSITTTERKESDPKGATEKTSVTTINQPTIHTYTKAVITGIAIRYTD